MREHALLERPTPLITVRPNNPWVGFGVLALLAVLCSTNPVTASMFGFAVAAYSAVANDAIQTLGTFLSSKRHVPWWVMTVLFGGIMAGLFAWSYSQSQTGDLAFRYLRAIPERDITLLMLLAPVTLLILTHYKVPVSTSILLLSLFSSKATLGSIITKSIGGWVVGFFLALVGWMIVEKFMVRSGEVYEGTNHPFWEYAQWASTSLLWGAWIMQDAANIVVFLPRSVSPIPAVLAVGLMFVLFGVLMWKRGGRIQEIVTEHSRMRDLREATCLDLLYAVILLGFKAHSPIPMSTTWLFLGLLAGRELSLADVHRANRGYGGTLRLIGKNLFRAATGVVISLGFYALNGYLSPH